jgi:nucleotidyltransferase substrate binding protein (TIGR01987 family)
MKDVRWKQRYQNFDRAFQRLAKALDGRPFSAYSELELAGLEKCFELAYELAWNLMKDYLEHEGVKIDSPTGSRNVIKAAFASGLVPDGQVWIDMLISRNVLSHTYDFSLLSGKLEDLRDRFVPALKSFHSGMEARL